MYDSSNQEQLARIQKTDVFGGRYWSGMGSQKLRR